LSGRLVELRLGRPGLVGGEPLDPEEQAQLVAAVDTLTRPALRGARDEARQGAAGLRLLALAPLDALDAEVRSLAQRWYDILGRAARLNPPVRLDPVASCPAALANALTVQPSQILVDDAAPLPDIRAVFSDTAVEHVPEAEWPIDLDGAFAEALSETIALP